MIKIKRIFKEAFLDFSRNGWLSITAIIIINLALLCVGIFTLMFLSTNKIVTDLKGRMDVIVNFEDTASDSLIQQLRAEIMLRPKIKTVKYISKEDALKEFKSRASVKTEIKDLVTTEENPLPRGLQIQSDDLNALQEASAILKSPLYAPYVNSSTYDDNETLISYIDNVTKISKYIGLGLSVFFMIVAMLVVYNTIKLAVVFKSKEMEIMRLVGASEAFVKFPLLIEGFMYGFVAVIISTGLLYLGLTLLQEFSKGMILDQLLQKMMPIYFSEFWFIVAVQLFIGTVLGLGSSWLSIKRNVKM